MAIISRWHLFYFNGLEINFFHVCFPGKILAFCFLIYPGLHTHFQLMQIVSLILFTDENYFLRLFSSPLPPLVFFFFAGVGRECESVKEEYVTLEKNVHLCRQHIHNTKATLQRVLTCWATYKEDLPLLKASFEATKKDQIKEVFEVNCTVPLLLFNFRGLAK